MTSEVGFGGELSAQSRGLLTPTISEQFPGQTNAVKGVVRHNAILAESSARASMLPTIEGLGVLLPDAPEGPYIRSLIACLNPPKHAAKLEEFLRHASKPVPYGLGMSPGTVKRATDALWPWLMHVGDAELTSVTKASYLDYIEGPFAQLDEATRSMYRLWINRFMAKYAGEDHANTTCPKGRWKSEPGQIVVEFLPTWKEILRLVQHCEGDLEKLARVVLTNASLIQPGEFPGLTTTMFSWDEVTGITIIQLPPSAGYPKGRPVPLAWGDEIVAAYIGQLRARGQLLLFPARINRNQTEVKATDGATFVNWLRNLAYDAGVRTRNKDNARRFNLTTCRQALACNLLSQEKGEQGVRQMLGIISSTQFAVFKQAALAYKAREKMRWGTRTDLVNTAYRKDCPVCRYQNATTAIECQRPGCRFRFSRGEHERVQVLKERVMLDVAQFLEAVGLSHRELAEQVLQNAKGGDT